MKSNMTTMFFFILVLLLPGPLQAATLFQQVGVASSPNPVGSGARATGMGGAFLAIADDATAASWNPAGLIQLESPEASVVGAFLSRREDFSSDTRPEIDNTGDVDDVNLNYLSVTYPFRLLNRNMVASVNYQRLFEFQRDFEHGLDFSSAGLDLVQQKKFSQDGYVGALGLAYAIQMTPRLSLGATLNIWTDRLCSRNGWDETYSERGVGTQGGVDVTMNTQIRDKYSEFRGVNVNLGLLWNIDDHWTMGAVFKTPFEADLLHRFSFLSTSTFGPPVDASVSSELNLTEDITLDMPLSYGLGVAFRVSDALSLALDIYRTDWSEYVLTDSLGNEFSPISGLPEGEAHIKDTTQVRFGAEYLFIGQEVVVPIRGGIFYDPEPGENLKDFFGISVGSGIAYKKFIFDIAYQLRWGNNIDTGNLINSSKADIIQHRFLTSVIVHF